MDTAPRPDPTRGVFETLLVVRGAPVELDAHLRRLHESARALFGDATAARLAGPARAAVLGRAEDAAFGRRLGAAAAGERPPDGGSEGDAGGRASAPAPTPLTRLRVDLAPTTGDTVDVGTRTAPVDPELVFPAHARGPSLAAVTVPGGLGAHKWADRRLLEAATADVSPALPLLVDADGSVLETDRANVFAVLGDAIVTPPTDGRILPGIARAVVLALARELGIAAEERVLGLDDLGAADAAFLTGSVRGIESVRAVGDRPLPASATIDRLVAALRDLWLGAS